MTACKLSSCFLGFSNLQRLYTDIYKDNIYIYICKDFWGFLGLKIHKEF